MLTGPGHRQESRGAEEEVTLEGGFQWSNVAEATGPTDRKRVG